MYTTKYLYRNKARSECQLNTRHYGGNSKNMHVMRISLKFNTVKTNKSRNVHLHYIDLLCCK